MSGGVVEAGAVSLFFGRQSRAVSYQDVFSRGEPLPLSPFASDAVQRLIPLYAAHRLITDSIGATPLHGYRVRGDGTSERLASQPKLLSVPPFGTMFGWKAQYAASVLSDGNAFGLVTGLDSTGWPAGLYWLNPYDVEVDETGTLPEFAYCGRPLPREAVVHVPWIVPPGRFRGISPLRAFRVSIEMGVAVQQVARDWYVSGAIPSGHLRTQGELTEEKADEAKRKFKQAVKGRDVLVTGPDWEYQTIGVPADDIRFIESYRLSASQVASIYGIPPEEIGGESGGTSLTYATLEQNDIKFNRRVVQPWAVRLEEALTAVMPRPQYAKFNLDANVRADLRTRMEAHEIAQRAGVETNDEARRLEDRQPLTELERERWLEAWGKRSTPAADGSGQVPATVKG